MGQAATSIVLILGQLALACAAPLYICTSVDGTQRVEWGACHCIGDDHGHELPAAAACEYELELAEPPCQCQHRPLSEGTQVVSRTQHDTRCVLLVLFADESGIKQLPLGISQPWQRFSIPRGHTALYDRLSICLRC